jgi:hypothetical protein
MDGRRVGQIDINRKTKNGKKRRSESEQTTNRERHKDKWAVDI